MVFVIVKHNGPSFESNWIFEGGIGLRSRPQLTRRLEVVLSRELSSLRVKVALLHLLMPLNGSVVCRGPV